MSVNQNTELEGAVELAPATAAKEAKSPRAAKDDSRTDMVGKALGLLVLLGDEPRGASAAELSRATRAVISLIPAARASATSSATSAEPMPRCW